MLVSEKWKTWRCTYDLKTCLECRKMNGKIYDASEDLSEKLFLHPFCRCIITALEALKAGTATINGKSGADWFLKRLGRLPPYYLAEDEADALGYESKKGNLHDVAPEKMLDKGVYMNRNGHLPEEYGRVWYEADINYVDGYRGTCRVLYSNDGLVFVTYDHYETFVEIV